MQVREEEAEHSAVAVCANGACSGAGGAAVLAPAGFLRHSVKRESGGLRTNISFAGHRTARIDTNSIAPSLDALSIEDSYAAFELAVGYGYATAETDTFSLAMVLLERLSGVSLSDIRANVEGEPLAGIPPPSHWKGEHGGATFAA